MTKDFHNLSAILNSGNAETIDALFTDPTVDLFQTIEGFMRKGVSFIDRCKDMEIAIRLRERGVKVSAEEIDIKAAWLTLKENGGDVDSPTFLRLKWVLEDNPALKTLAMDDFDTLLEALIDCDKVDGSIITELRKLGCKMAPNAKKLSYYMQHEMTQALQFSAEDAGDDLKNLENNEQSTFLEQAFMQENYKYVDILRATGFKTAPSYNKMRIFTIKDDHIESPALRQMFSFYMEDLTPEGIKEIQKEEGYTLLESAYDSDKPEIAKLWRAMGFKANPSAYEICEVFESGNFEYLKILIEDAKLEVLMTPLWLKASHINILESIVFNSPQLEDFVKLLRDRGVKTTQSEDVVFKVPFAKDPLFAATQLVKDGVNINMLQSLSGKAMLEFCEDANTIKCLRKLGTKSNPQSKSLMQAVMLGRALLAQMFLEDGADVNSKDEFGDSVLVNALEPWREVGGVEKIRDIILNCPRLVIENIEQRYVNTLLAYLKANKLSSPAALTFSLDASQGFVSEVNTILADNQFVKSAFASMQEYIAVTEIAKMIMEYFGDVDHEGIAAAAKASAQLAKAAIEEVTDVDAPLQSLGEASDLDYYGFALPCVIL